jgi:G3E family GTPase
MQINYSLGLLLETRSEDIYRLKGLLSIHGSEYRYVFQVGTKEGGCV